MDNLKNMGKFLETYDQDCNDLKINSRAVESVIKSLPTNKTPGPDSFTGVFYQTFEDLIPSLLKLSQEIEKEGMVSNSFY